MKEATQLMYANKELAYVRKSALYRIREVVYTDSASPEERIDGVKDVLKTLGLEPREGG